MWGWECSKGRLQRRLGPRRWGAEDVTQGESLQRQGCGPPCSGGGRVTCGRRRFPESPPTHHTGSAGPQSPPGCMRGGDKPLISIHFHLNCLNIIPGSSQRPLASPAQEPGRPGGSGGGAAPEGQPALWPHSRVSLLSPHPCPWPSPDSEGQIRLLGCPLLWAGRRLAQGPHRRLGGKARLPRECAAVAGLAGHGASPWPRG